MTDFPRLQYLIVLAVVAVGIALARPVSNVLRIGLAVVAVAAIAFNVWKLAPYLPGESDQAQTCTPENRVSVMVANVKLENNEAEPLLNLVRERQPDVLLALETNEFWDRQLSALSDEMPHALSMITGSYYGMHMLSRLPLSNSDVVVPVGQDTPAILTTATLPSGATTRFIGIHPRPPHPGQSSTGRDAVLMWAAINGMESEDPAIVAGDLNAVSWESTVEHMQRIGSFVDPREIFGFLPSYDAQSAWMAWPLDHVMHQQGLAAQSMTVLPSIGSDHYPVELVMCHQDVSSEAPQVQDGDLERAQEIIETSEER